jgi:hypothetical protein
VSFDEWTKSDNLIISPVFYIPQSNMFRFITFVLAIACTSAFMAPSARRSSTGLKMAFEDALGAQPPLGFWDPLGLLKEADEKRFNRLREVEMKHGRIAMLAILGHIVTAAGIRFPGEIAFGLPYTAVKPGLGALFTVPIEGLTQIILFIGLLEVGFKLRKEEIEEVQIAKAIEKFGWTPEIVAKKTAIELNNGRAAQMGILALMVHEKLDGNPYIINSLLGFPVGGF